MSSRKTWERRVLAPLIEKLEAEGVFIIEGMTVVIDDVEDEDGLLLPSHLVFSHEELSEAESQRVYDTVDTVLNRLRRMYGQVPGHDEATEIVEVEEDMAPADSDAEHETINSYADDVYVDLVDYGPMEPVTA